jgi:hypothetical protein
MTQERGGMRIHAPQAYMHGVRIMPRSVVLLVLPQNLVVDLANCFWSCEAILANNSQAQ